MIAGKPEAYRTVRRQSRNKAVFALISQRKLHRKLTVCVTTHVKLYYHAMEV